MSKTKVTMTTDLRAGLDALQCQRWQAFWAQEGAFEFHPATSGVYTIASLTIEAEDLIRISASSVDVERGREVFALDVRIEREIGTIESERLWRPPRRRITTFPRHLDLRAFCGMIDSLELLCNANIGIKYFDGLLVHRGTKSNMFLTSSDIPESVIVTSNEAFIGEATRTRESMNPKTITL